MNKETKEYKISLPDILLVTVIINFFLLNFGEKVAYVNMFLHLFSVGIVYMFAIFVFFLSFITSVFKKSFERKGLCLNNGQNWLQKTIFMSIKTAVIVYYFYFSSAFFSPKLNAITASVYFVFSAIRMLTPSAMSLNKKV